MFFITCVVNGTSPNLIYSDGHTFSLHDALPNSKFNHSPHTWFRIQNSNRTTSKLTNSFGRGAMSTIYFGTTCFVAIFNKESQSQKQIQQTRSDAHTSELQSLMRSSYAVVSLKKTKTYFTYNYNITNDKT